MTSINPRGNYLVIETATGMGSVAAASGSDIVAEVTLEGRDRQLEQITDALDQVTRVSGVARREWSGVVVGEGPGSFTGVRIAASVGKGLSHALELPLWPVSSLAAAAMSGSKPQREPSDEIRYILFDARGDRIYGACYRYSRAGDGDAGALEVVVPPHAGTLTEVLEDVPSGAVFAGEGAVRHRTTIQGAGQRVAGAPIGHPSATGLWRAVCALSDLSPVHDAYTWEPSYLRGASARVATK